MDRNEHTFMVFARKTHDEPLQEVGSVTVAGIEQVKDAALGAYSDDDWLEMVAIPQTALVSVFVEA